MRDDVLTCRTAVPACPGCGETQRIEPLRRLGSTWYLRCLVCHMGIRMRVSRFVSFKERRAGANRPRAIRGLRASDTAPDRPCPYCRGELSGWLTTPETIWWRCVRCGRVTALQQAEALAARTM